MWATAFYEANILFDVVRHPTFVYAVHETAHYKMPAYKPPSYNAIRTTLLAAKKKNLEKQVKEKLGNSIEKYSVTICCDGWDNVQNWPLFNMAQCGIKRDVFLGTIDTTENHKDHTYVATQILSFVQKVRADIVVEICIDNAPVMSLAACDVVRLNPYMYFQGYATHYLDMLLEDWTQQDWMKKVIKKARLICVFIKNHHASQAIFQRLSPDLSINVPTETRFATNFIMIDRLVQVCNALERMVVDDDWFIFIGALRRRSHTTYMKCFAVKWFVRFDGFWNTCKNFFYMVIHVVKALRVFNGKAPAMGLAWKVMHDLETHVREFVEPPFALSADLAAEAMSTFQNRWWMMLTDLHWAGAMLNPILRGWAPLHEHVHSRRILNQVFRKCYPDDNTYVEVLNQYQDFLENRGPFADSTDPSVHVAPLHEWWDIMGGGAKALQTIARRILVQVCSALACERNWSMYSFVHNKVRNCLKHSRDEDLVYIYTNSRLLRHHKGPTPTQRYRLNMVHSNDDLYGDDQDDDEDQDPHKGGDDIDNNDIESIDFDINNLDSDDSHSDGNDDGGDGNFAIFDFNEEVMICPNEARHVHHEGPIEGPPFGSLSAEQGLWHDHNVATVVIGTVQSNVGASQPLNDSFCFGQCHDGDDALRINEPLSVLYDTVPIVVHIEIANASFESNHPIQIEALYVPEPNTTPTPTTVGNA